MEHEFQLPDDKDGCLCCPPNCIRTLSYKNSIILQMLSAVYVLSPRPFNLSESIVYKSTGSGFQQVMWD